MVDRMRGAKASKCNAILTDCVTVVLTFVYVGGQTSHKHLTGEALDAFPVLVRVTVGGAKDSWDALVAVAVIEEVVIDGEEGGAAWWRKKAVMARANVEHSHKHAQAETQITDTNLHPVKSKNLPLL